jgi:hydrogenase maturation factor
LESVGVVEDATLSASVGLRTNVRAMHDVAEGGLFSAVADLSEASGLKATIDLSSVPVSEEVEAICRLFHINPYSSLGSGSLLIVSRPQATRQVIRRLRNHRINASVIGSLSRKGKGNIILKEGRTHVLKRPKSDPYWKAFWKASVKGLK